MEVGDFEACENLLGAVGIVPCLLMLHAVHEFVEMGVAFGGKARLILPNEVGDGVSVPKTGFDDGEVVGVIGRLRKIAHPQIAPIHHGASIMTFFAREYVHKGALPSAVAGDESHLLPLGDAEGDVAKQQTFAYVFGERIDLEIWIDGGHKDNV